MRKLILFYLSLLSCIFIVLPFFKINSIDLKIQYVEYFVDVINIICSCMIFVKFSKINKLFFLLPLNMTFLFLMDIEYQLVYYFRRPMFLLFEFITFTWYAITIISILIILIKYIYNKFEVKIIFASFIMFIFSIISFFSPHFVRFLSYPYNSIDLTCHMSIFYLCILLIIVIKDKLILTFIIGLSVLEIANFAMTECYLQNAVNFLSYGEIGFLIGEIIISISMMYIIFKQKNKITNWIFNTNSIRNKLSFIIFSISIWSFIIACIIVKIFNHLNDNSFIFIPSLGMLYSTMTATIAIIISKKIESPFKQIQYNIQQLFENNQFVSIYNDINIIEFQNLNKFIINAYNYKKSMEEHLISNAIRIAHDIKSPISIIKNALINENYSSELIDKQIAKINYISKSLLKDNNINISKGVQNLYCCIDELIKDKQIEWDLKSQIINYTYKSSIIWLSDKQAQIKQILSNLLNNSYEAILDNSTINILVEQVFNNVIITIEDFGCGINKENLEEILNGKSLKVSGNGIGLSSAKKFMNEINGNFFIKTSDDNINHGTTIRLMFNTIHQNNIFANKIILKTKNIVIVDDCDEVILFWQKFFLTDMTNKSVKYYQNYVYFENNCINDDTTYLLDYKILSNNITGVKIIKQYNLNNVYLITDYADDFNLQEELKNLNAKLIPKGMLSVLKQNNCIIN